MHRVAMARAASVAVATSGSDRNLFGRWIRV